MDVFEKLAGMSYREMQEYDWPSKDSVNDFLDMKDVEMCDLLMGELSVEMKCKRDGINCVKVC